MRPTHVISATITAIALMTLVVPSAEAGSRGTIEFIDTRAIDSPVGSATTSLPGCPEATSVDQRAQATFAPPHGIFVGIRDFQCDEDSGFVVRLTAMFDADGSTGTWSIVSSYGGVSGLRGSGTLVGTPTQGGGIIDHYTGSITMP